MLSSEKVRKPILLVLVFSFLGWGVISLRHVGDSQYYAPAQPIPFSHKLHAGQYNIECMYCHVGVEKSRHATVPPMNVCMNCHSVVKPDSPYIQQLKTAYEKGEPIQWVKVHDMPDFVNFNHKRHVTKGIACETCHGEVKQMERITQEKPLTMGWCLNCHRGITAPEHLYEDKAHQFGVASDDGGLGHTRPAVVIAGGGDPTKVPPTSTHPGTPVAPTSCYTCHH